MKRNFTANILFLIGINILIKPFYTLAIDTSIQNIVGPEAYGLFFALFNFVYIQQIFADLGIQNFNNRDISQNPEKLETIFPKVLGAKVLFTLFFICVTLLTAWFFGYLQYFDKILVYIIASQASLSMLLYLRTNISGSARYFTDSLFSVLDKLILILWMSYVIWGNPGVVDISISYFVKVQFFSIFIALILILLFTHKNLSRLRLEIDAPFIRKLLLESLPYASLVLMMAGYSKLDGIMLEQLIDDNALTAGEYGRSFRLYDTLNNFTFLFAVLLLPMFSRMLKREEDVNDVVIWAFRILGLGSVFAIVTAYFQGKEILAFFYHTEGGENYMTLVLLLVAGLALSLNYIYGTLLTANGSIRILNKIAIFGLAINLILNYLVIPKYGQEGAAFTTVVTQFTVLILQVYYCYKDFKLTGLFPSALRILVIALISSGVYFTLETLPSMHFLLKIALVGILCLILAFLIRLIRLADLKVV